MATKWNCFLIRWKLSGIGSLYKCENLEQAATYTFYCFTATIYYFAINQFDKWKWNALLKTYQIGIWKGFFLFLPQLQYLRHLSELRIDGSVGCWKKIQIIFQITIGKRNLSCLAFGFALLLRNNRKKSTIGTLSYTYTINSNKNWRQTQCKENPKQYFI